MVYLSHGLEHSGYDYLDKKQQKTEGMSETFISTGVLNSYHIL